uniref:Polyprenal reductase n=1 Tax=Cyclopterus lumpus TaxID=8103 RepID=A0A8C2ZTI0_CYCLU
MNFPDVFWSFLASCFFAAFCAHKLSTHLPRRHVTGRAHVLFQDLIRYGKTKQRVQRESCVRAFDVPKRWFWHFYAISVVWNGLLLGLYLNATFQHQSYPSWLTGLLDILTDAPAIPQLSTLLLLVLLCVHSLRRLLECLLVSVFSDGALNLMQYAFGVFYYVALGLTVLCSDRTGPLLSQLHWSHVAGGTLFIGASVMQHQSTVLLAGLRTGKSGAVETLAHAVPKGGWFELVSCPHYLAELLIYVSLSLVVGGLSLTWWLVVLYVLFNQALAAQLCHDLYVSKYESYPRHRKAFIPFVL